MVYYRGISLAGDTVKWLYEHRTFSVSGVLWTVLENPRESLISGSSVPITASGPRGEQPLAK